jgi:hypothetical protein
VDNFISSDKILIMGRSGCGKSFLCRNLQTMWPRRVIIDSLGEYNDEPEKFNSFNSISNRLITASRENHEEFTLVFQFDPENENADETFNELIRILYYFGNILIVIEEVQLYSNPHFLPHWLRNSLLTGRHRNVGLIFTSQRPGEVNKTIVSQCRHLFCGNLIDKNDINYVAGFLNSESNKLINLKDRKFIYRGPDGIKEVENNFLKNT